MRTHHFKLNQNVPSIPQIEKYIRNTGDETHYRIDIVQIFRASREGENERFKKVRIQSSGHG
jgi:hypothetical protein